MSAHECAFCRSERHFAQTKGMDAQEIRWMVLQGLSCTCAVVLQSANGITKSRGQPVFFALPGLQILFLIELQQKLLRGSLNEPLRPSSCSAHVHASSNALARTRMPGPNIRTAIRTCTCMPDCGLTWWCHGRIDCGPTRGLGGLR